MSPIQLSLGRDAVIIKKGLTATCLAELPDASIIGTGTVVDRVILIPRKLDWSEWI
jgi:hypothetical protein